MRRGGVGMGLAVLALLGVPAAAVAQAPTASDAAHVTMLLRDASLDQALDLLVKASGISLVYDPALVEKRRIFCRADAIPAEALLRCIVREAGLDFYRLSSGTYVIIRSVAEAPRVGNLAGVVVDEASGEPLPAARVSIDRPALARETGAAGLFSFASLPPGRYRLEARAIGYRPVVREIDLPPDGTVRQRVALERQAVDLGTLVVNGVALSPADKRVGARPLAVDSLPDVVDGPSFLLRTASAQLGITQQAALGDLHIQGGDPGEHQLRLDGAPVFDPLPPGRFFGAFSPLAIERLTIRRAGFGVAHGSFTAGAIDLEHAADAGPRPTAELAADPYSVAARVASPWTLGGRRGSTMVAARTSLWNVVTGTPLANSVREWTGVDRVLLDRFRGPVPGLAISDAFVPTAVTTDIGFTDVHLASRLELGSYRSISGSLYFANNNAGTDLAAVASPAAGADVALASSDHYRWREFAGQLRHDQLVGARTSHSVQVRASRHRLQHQLAVQLPGDPPMAPADMPHEGNEVLELGLQSSLRHAVGWRSELEGGLEVVHTASSMVMDNGVYRNMDSESAALRAAAYGQLRHQIGNSTWLEGGLRLTWVPSRAAAYAEPRLALHGERASADGSFAWRIAGGVHRQFINQFALAAVGPSALVPSVRIWLPVSATLAPPEAWHLGAEGAWRTTSGWEFRSEAYLKWLPVIQALDYAALLDRSTPPTTDVSAAPIVAEARGYAVGGGIRAARSTGPFRFELGYDLGISRRTFPSRFGGEAQPTPWNEPHRVLGLVDVRPTSALAFSFLARGVWGRTWPLRQAYYDLLLVDNSTGSGVSIGQPGETNLPPLYEVDLGATYSVVLGGLRIQAGAAVLNALGRRNVLDSWLQPQAAADGSASFQAVPRAMLGRQTMLTLRIGA